MTAGAAARPGASSAREPSSPPPGAPCGRKCISHKCYCAKDPWNREECSDGPRKCCYWSWGYWECEGAVVVEEQQNQPGGSPAQMPLALPRDETPKSA